MAAACTEASKVVCVDKPIALVTIDGSALKNFRFSAEGTLERNKKERGYMNPNFKRLGAVTIDKAMGTVFRYSP